MHLSAKGQRAITLARPVIVVAAGLLALTSQISWNVSAFISATAVFIGNTAIGRLQRGTSSRLVRSPSDRDADPDR